MRLTSRIMPALAMIAAAVLGLRAEAEDYTDQEIKEQFIFAGRCRHAEDIASNYGWAFHMSGDDTNRYARILRELAVENTNKTGVALRKLGLYKTTQSLPFLYAYATNAVYGAEALKSIFAIEGVTSNSIAVSQSYFYATNFFCLDGACERSKLCQSLLKRVYANPELSVYRSTVFDMSRDYNAIANVTSPNCVDVEMCAAEPSYKFTKRRLAALRLCFSNVNNYFNNLPEGVESYDRRVHVFSCQTNYLSTAINELVAYPEADLPD